MWLICDAKSAAVRTETFEWCSGQNQVTQVCINQDQIPSPHNIAWLRESKSDRLRRWSTGFVFKGSLTGWGQLFLWSLWSRGWLGHDLGLGFQRGKLAGKPESGNRRGYSCKDKLQLDTHCPPCILYKSRGLNTDTCLPLLADKAVPALGKGAKKKSRVKTSEVARGSVVLGLEEIMPRTVTGREVMYLEDKGRMSNGIKQQILKERRWQI